MSDPGESDIPHTTSTLTVGNRWDHILARVGWKRSGHRVTPGLYKLGRPGDDSPVFVTANYTLSFDALRSALAGIAGYILVLDTKGINVWCAAGKGTCQLHDVVSHRKLIVPQLGAPGVAAHTVKKRSGFKVEYGPVLATDLPEYLESREATPEMRRVRFGLRDRAVLIPVEFSSFLVLLWVLVFGFRIVTADASAIPEAAFLAAILAGLLVFPVLLPWLPTRDFSSKGLILGGLVAMPFAILTLLSPSESAWWRQAMGAVSLILIATSITAFLALNFTGSTTFTSRSGVRREMFAYIPVMAWMCGLGVASRAVLYFV